MVDIHDVIKSRR